MSVHTQADDCIDEAMDAIDEAVQALSRVITEQVWGTDEYGADYKRRVREAFNELLEARDKINS